MSKKQPVVKGGPELERQLAAADAGAAVEAVFTLRPPAGTPLLDEGQVRGTVDRIVKSAQAEVGQKVRDLHVWPNVQSFALAAPPDVVRAVLNCGEVESAMANAQPEDLAIEPVPRPAKKPPAPSGGKPRKR